MNLVIDCSFVISAVLPDEKDNNLDEIFKQISKGTYSLYVPSIFYLECNNALLSALKKQRICKTDYEEYLEILNQLPIKVDKFCSYPESLYSIGRISTNYDLTAYDSSYLELALRIDAKIASLDKKLVESCKLASIETIVNL